MLFVITVVIICQIKPKLGPAGEWSSLTQKVKSLVGLLDAAVLFILVIGGIFLGFFSPTVAGAIGAAGAIIIGVIRRGMSWKKFLSGLQDGLRLTCMLFILVVGAYILQHFIARTGLSQSLVDWVVTTGLSPLGIVIFVAVCYFIMGCFMDMAPLLWLMTPLFYPLIEKSGYDGIWFGVIVIILCMIAIVTPPVASNLYVVKTLAGKEASLGEISKGLSIFIIPLVVGLVLIIAFPSIATFLPSFMTY